MNLNRVFALTAAVFIGFTGAFTASAQEGKDQFLDLVTHNSVLIEAAPAQIWPKIIDPSEWKAGAQLVLLEGDPAQAGAKFKAVMPNAPDQVAFYTTNVEVLPEQRRTVRLNTPDGALMGFAIWELTPVGDGTEVAYHVYTQAVIPGAALASMSAAEVEAWRTDYVPSNYQRFQAELEALKKMVESYAAH
jgi:hypothetical protein